MIDFILIESGEYLEDILNSMDLISKENYGIRIHKKRNKMLSKTDEVKNIRLGNEHLRSVLSLRKQNYE